MAAQRGQHRRGASVGSSAMIDAFLSPGSTAGEERGGRHHRKPSWDPAEGVAPPVRDIYTILLEQPTVVVRAREGAESAVVISMQSADLKQQRVGAGQGRERLSIRIAGCAVHIEDVSAVSEEESRRLWHTGGWFLPSGAGESAAGPRQPHHALAPAMDPCEATLCYDYARAKRAGRVASTGSDSEDDASFEEAVSSDDEDA